MQPTNRPQNPNDPVIMAIQQQAQQQTQQPQQGAQPQQPTPSPIQMAQAQSQQYSQEDQQSEDAMKAKQSAIAQASKAMATLNPKANSGNQVSDTMSKVGQATSPNQGWANLCEAYAEQQTLGHQGVYPTAIAAYNANAQAGNINTSSDNIPKGAQIFFNANEGNGGNGHTMVSVGGGKFQSPLQNGNIGTFTLPEWEKYSGGQQYLGYAMPSKK